MRAMPIVSAVVVLGFFLYASTSIMAVTSSINPTSFSTSSKPKEKPLRVGAVHRVAAGGGEGVGGAVGGDGGTERTRDGETERLRDKEI